MVAYEIVQNDGESGGMFTDSEVAWNVFDASPVGERLVKYAQDGETIVCEWEATHDGIITLQGTVVDPSV